MTSLVETGEGVESILTKTGVLQQRMRFDKSYGAMTTVMEYLLPIEQLRLQGLDTWQYKTGVGRVQVHFEMLPEMFYFVDEKFPFVLAINGTGECKWFGYRGESDFSNAGQFSCQVGQTRLFQCNGDSFRILKIDRSQRNFTVERQQAWPGIKQLKYVMNLTNFKDQFIFLFNPSLPVRYSLAEDRFEEIPPHKDSLSLSACSLGDKVYTFADYYGENLIHVLHNPGASISSQELHWQVIEVPENIVEPRSSTAFVPLNSTEIVILGGEVINADLSRDVITFNTSTFEFKKELEGRTEPLNCQRNQIAKVCENTIIALNYKIIAMNSHQKGFPRLIKYTKGDTCITSLKM